MGTIVRLGMGFNYEFMMLRRRVCAMRRVMSDCDDAAICHVTGCSHENLNSKQCRDIEVNCTVKNST